MLFKPAAYQKTPCTASCYPPTRRTAAMGDNYDAVRMDGFMPVMNGLDATKNIGNVSQTI
jgi:CheY-like chemotaxis protein